MQGAASFEVIAPLRIVCLIERPGIRSICL